MIDIAGFVRFLMRESLARYKTLRLEELVVRSANWIRSVFEQQPALSEKTMLKKEVLEKALAKKVVIEKVVIENKTGRAPKAIDQLYLVAGAGFEPTTFGL